jgi:hypothetical protein
MSHYYDSDDDDDHHHYHIDAGSDENMIFETVDKKEY